MQATFKSISHEDLFEATTEIENPTDWEIDHPEHDSLMEEINDIHNDIAETYDRLDAKVDAIQSEFKSIFADLRAELGL